ncbi:MAG: hypothetical protein C4329_08680 [Chitinophagaceae bacterium]
MELSYRAQLKGWKIIYADDVAVPAELPAVMQAFSWTKGIAQTCKKNVQHLLQLKMPFSKKVHSLFPC